MKHNHFHISVSLTLRVTCWVTCSDLSLKHSRDTTEKNSPSSSCKIHCQNVGVENKPVSDFWGIICRSWRPVNTVRMKTSQREREERPTPFIKSLLCAYCVPIVCISSSWSWIRLFESDMCGNIAFHGGLRSCLKKKEKRWTLIMLWLIKENHFLIFCFFFFQWTLWNNFEPLFFFHHQTISK